MKKKLKLLLGLVLLVLATACISLFAACKTTPDDTADSGNNSTQTPDDGKKPDNPDDDGGKNDGKDDGKDTHEHAYIEIAEEKYIKSEATCTAKAVYFKSCSVCGEAGTETFEHGTPNGHSFTKENAEEKYLKDGATCTAKAVYFKSCSVCGEKGTETFEYGSPTAHSFTEENADVKYLKEEATCTAKAVYYKSCSVCGEKGTETFEYGSPTAHSFTEENADVKYLKEEATCTESAVYFKSCSVCGEKGTETFEHGTPNGHTEVTDEAVAATCTKKGKTEGKHCGVCKAVLVEQTETEMTAHVFLNYVSDKNYTCTADGTKTATCENCTQTNTVADEGSAKHKYNANNRCVWCNSERCSEGLLFSLNSTTHTYTVSGGTCEDTDIYIPSKYEGISVTTVNYFSANPELENIYLPNGITTIYDRAFNGCSRLESINIPNTVTKIGQSAFSGCYNLLSIKIPRSVTSMGKSVFTSCNKAIIYCEAASRPNTWENTWLGNNTNPVSSTIIWDCNNKVYTSGTPAVEFLTDGGLRYFFKYDGNRQATVNTQSYKLSGDIIIDQSIVYSDSLTLTVTSLIEYAFGSCVDIKSVTLPDSVTEIGVGAFFTCRALERIVIPANITAIADYTFKDCANLKDITFKGTMAQWKQLSKTGDWNKNTGDYIITCSDGKLDKYENEITK